MLESGLFFTLGFLCSALLALMLAPAVWRRAVVLTRQRIESSVPLTLNEIQADKDQLRAEFAMSTRRLEISLESLKERAAEQLIEINRRREMMQELGNNESAKEARIAELEAQSSELWAELAQREERLAEASSTLTSVEVKLEERALAFEELNQKYQSAIEDFDGQKIELVASETLLDTIKDEAQDIKQVVKSKDDEIKSLRSENKSAATSLKTERRRCEEMEAKITRLQGQLTDAEDRLENKDSDLKKVRGKSGKNGSQVTALQKELDKTNSDKVKLEAEIADIRLRMEALLENTASENIDDVVATFEGERKTLDKEMRKVTKERDTLRNKLMAVEKNTSDDWETERRENAIVRERINDLAAQVTAMTASLEGPSSPINASLKSSKKRVKKATVAGKKSSQAATDTVLSLADRIRALQAATEKA